MRNSAFQASEVPSDVGGDGGSRAIPRRALTLFDATSIIVGIIIGAGIYQTTPLVARFSDSVAGLLGVWVVGGLLAAIGALCYADLACAYPEDGGDYVYLKRAFGRRLAFVFAWCELWIVRPGSIGAMAFIFASYANQLYALGAGPYAFAPYAVGAIVVLTAINMLGVRQGKWTQNLLTVAKVLGLLGLLVVAWSGPGAIVAPAAPVERAAEVPSGLEAAPASEVAAAASMVDYRVALILVLFTYGGWNEVAYVAAEVRNPDRNILAALMCGLALVAGVYVLTNLAFVHTLGLAGLQSSDAPAADVLTLRWGAAGGRAISLLVCLSTLGAINGQIFTGARIYYALGGDHSLFRFLGRWNPRHEAPIWSLAVQALATLAPVLVFGSGEDGFTRLLVFTAPVCWFFFVMVGVAVFVLSKRDGERPRAFRVPAYPWTPLLFCLLSGWMLYASIAYAYEHRSNEAGWAIGIVLAGAVVSFLMRSPLGDRSAPRV